jgi:hypothetical protein
MNGSDDGEEKQAIHNSKHIRPKRRTPPRLSSSEVTHKPSETVVVPSVITDLNDNAAGVIQSWCSVPTTTTATKGNRASAMEPLVSNDTVARPNVKDVLSTACAASTQTQTFERVEKKSPAGILRRLPKYSAAARNGRAEECEAEEVVNETPPVLVVQEFVVERPKRSKTKASIRQPSHNNSKKSVGVKSPLEVEGYTPRTQATTTFRAVSKAAVEATEQTTLKIVKEATDGSADDDEDEPLIFNSLADMMAMAGTLPDQDDVPAVLEAELNFSCADPAEYMEEQQEIFLGKQHIFEDDDDENTEPHSDEDDEEEDGCLFDVLGLGGGGSEDDEEVEPVPPPRAFIQLWTAIAQWVTPQAVAFVRNVHANQQQQEASQHLLAPSFDRSDVGASRCGGLMAALHLHTARCWNSLGQPADDLRAAETVLADLVRCFDYSRSSPKMDIALTRALTCVLLDMVVSQQQQSREDGFVPGPCQALGMKPEEYRYLVRSAISNFGETTTADKVSTDQ